MSLSKHFFHHLDDSVVEWVYRGTAARKVRRSGPERDFFPPKSSTDGPTDSIDENLEFFCKRITPLGFTLYFSFVFCFLIQKFQMKKIQFYHNQWDILVFTGFSISFYTFC